MSRTVQPNQRSIRRHQPSKNASISPRGFNTGGRRNGNCHPPRVSARITRSMSISGCAIRRQFGKPFEEERECAFAKQQRRVSFLSVPENDALEVHCACIISTCRSVSSVLPPLSSQRHAPQYFLDWPEGQQPERTFLQPVANSKLFIALAEPMGKYAIHRQIYGYSESHLPLTGRLH